MSSIGDKKVALNLSDGTSVNLNKPIDIPSTVTDIMQITEPGWYHGKFTFSIKIYTGGSSSSSSPDDVEATVGVSDRSTIKNTPAIKIKDTLTQDLEHNFDVFVTKTGDYIFSLAGHLFYGVIDGSGSINWEIVSPLVVDDLTSTSTDKALSANQGKELKSLIDGLDIKTIDSSITDLASITESGTYIGTTDFDRIEEYNGDIAYVPPLENWPGMIIHGDGALSAIPYVLRVTNAYTEQRHCIYYELLCVAVGNKKAFGSNTDNGRIAWINDIPRIEDSLTSYSSECALSARQGRYLKEMIDEKLNNPKTSTTDLIAGNSALVTGEFYFVYD